MNKNNTDTKHNPTKNKQTEHKQTEHKQTERNSNNNEFKTPAVGSYIRKKTPEEVHKDLLESFNNNEGHQK